MKYRIGVDLGGTNIAVGVVDEDNRIVGRASTPTALPRSADDIAMSIADACAQAMADAQIDKTDVLSVGVGTPGAVNSDGVVENDANLGFKNTPLRDMVMSRVGLPTYIGNDANCAALGEQIAGAGRGTRNFFMVTLGTGIGGGIVIDGKLLTGVNGAAGEIGHMSIDFAGETCQCGRMGCFEQYASASALVRMAKARVLDVKCAKDVFDLAQDGDVSATDVLDLYFEYLSTGIANLINIFQPEIIALGGGIAGQGEELI
ncbi:MAG: ROK family protein, partial [Clostridia bacterium]|nr:ROK family protein [Clostridia bacterium]